MLQRRQTLYWIIRIVALTVLASAFYSNYAIDHDSLAWHENAAFAIVFFFSLFGSMSWLRSTYTSAELKQSQESKTVKLFWWLLIAVIALLMLTFIIAGLAGF